MSRASKALGMPGLPSSLHPGRGAGEAMRRIPHALRGTTDPAAVNLLSCDGRSPFHIAAAHGAVGKMAALEVHDAFPGWMNVS